MAGRYAAETSVSPEKSRMEIEATLTRYEADSFAYVQEQGHAVVLFTMKGRKVRFDLPLPSRDDPTFKRTPTGRSRDRQSVQAAYEQAVRQRWRALFLTIKALLEAVEIELVTFDQAFLAHIMVEAGGTVGQALIPKLGEITDQRALMAPFQYSAYAKQIESGEG